MWGSLLFIGQALFHLSGYINSHNSKCGVLKTHMHCKKILCICQNQFCMFSILKMKWGSIVLGRDCGGRMFSASAVITHCL